MKRNSIININSGAMILIFLAFMGIPIYAIHQNYSIIRLEVNEIKLEIIGKQEVNKR